MCHRGESSRRLLITTVFEFHRKPVVKLSDWNSVSVLSSWWPKFNEIMTVNFPFEQSHLEMLGSVSSLLIFSSPRALN
jgi:hypothetical protein